MQEMGGTLSFIAADNPMQLQELASDGYLLHQSQLPLIVVGRRHTAIVEKGISSGQWKFVTGMNTGDGIWVACNSAGFYAPPSVDIKL